MRTLLRLAAVGLVCAFCITCGVVFAAGVTVTGTATNTYVGDVNCTFTLENSAVSGKCSNAYFGDINFGNNAGLELVGSVYNLTGFGVFASPFTVATSLTANNIYLEGADPVQIIGTEITGTMKNGVVGDMVFGEVAVPVCGNGTVEYGEECDDGNAEDSDGCDSECNTEEGATVFTLAGSYPPNGALDIAITQPFTFIFSDDVDRDSFEDNADFGGMTGISFEWLTNAVVRVTHGSLANNTVYTVIIPTTVKNDVGGVALNTAYSFSFQTVISGVTAPVITCGDGYIATDEDCDDGDRTSDDGCSATCAIESGWFCAGVPSYCYQANPVCGDGNVDVLTDTYYGYGTTTESEGCDDGNVVSGDGCNASCEVESGFQCFGTHPSSCLVISGGSVVTPEISFPTLFTWYDTEASARVTSETYRVYLPGYEPVGSELVQYDAQTGEFYIDSLPEDVLVGTYLFTVKNTSTGDIVNARLQIADVAKFFSPQGVPLVIQWLTAIISAAPGEDPAGLGGEDKSEQVALFLSLMRELEESR